MKIMRNVREFKKPDAFDMDASGRVLASGDLCGDLFEFVSGHHVVSRPVSHLGNQQPIVAVNPVLPKIVPELNRTPGSLDCPLGQQHTHGPKLLKPRK